MRPGTGRRAPTCTHPPGRPALPAAAPHLAPGVTSGADPGCRAQVTNEPHHLLQESPSCLWPDRRHRQHLLFCQNCLPRSPCPASCPLPIPSARRRAPNPDCVLPPLKPTQEGNKKHLDQPVPDTSNQGLGASRDLGVGEQDLESWGPAGWRGDGEELDQDRCDPELHPP